MFRSYHQINVLVLVIGETISQVDYVVPEMKYGYPSDLSQFSLAMLLDLLIAIDEFLFRT